MVADASGMSRNTVIKAAAEVDAGIEPSVRLRPIGWGGQAGEREAARADRGARRAGASRDSR